MSDATYEGEERRGMHESRHRKDDNPTWRWVAVTALGVMATLAVLTLQIGINFAAQLNEKVQAHDKTIAIIQQDVTYIKDGVEKLVGRD